MSNGMKERELGAAVDRWMSELAHQTRAPKMLPSAGLVLFKAKLAAKRSARDMAVRPIRWCQTASAALTIATALGIWMGNGQIALPSLNLLANAIGSILPLLTIGLVMVVALSGFFVFIFGKERKNR